MFEIGNSLREARERQELEFTQLEADTKIRAKYLRALEEERFDLLPAESYARGFLEVYATRLGLDRQLYVDEFDSRSARGEGETERVRRVHTERRLRFEESALVFGLLGILIVTVLVIAAWQFSGGRPEPAPPQQASAPVPLPGPAPAPAPALSVPPAPTPEPQPLAADEEIILEDAELVVTAIKPNARVTVRRNGSHGRVIFAGSLARGESRSFIGRRLHAAFRDPAIFNVSVNDEPLATVPRRLVATVGGWRRG